MNRLTTIFFVFVALGLFVSARANAAKIYMLPVGDVEDSEIGSAIEANLGMARTLFRHAVSGEMIVYRELTDSRLTVDNLFAAINNCPVTEDDCLIVWYSGKGRDRDGEKFLELSGATVTRARLVEAIQAKSARVKVLVTDRCQTLLKSDVPRRAGDVPSSRGIALGFDQLLLKERGFFDFDSAGPNSAGIYLSGAGGLLTLALAYPEGKFLRLPAPDRPRKDTVKVASGGALSPRTGTLWDTLDDEQADWEFLRDQTRALVRKYVRDTTNGAGRNLADRNNGPTSAKPEPPPVDSISSKDLPEVVSVNINDILIAIDGKKLASPSDLQHAAKAAGQVSLVFAENFTGLVYECRLDMKRQDLSAISVEAIRGLGLQVTAIEDPDTLFDMKPVAARALAEKDIPFGIGGKFVKISDHPNSLPEMPLGMLVESVRPNSPAAMTGLEKGDILLMIGDVYFSNAEGYRFALKTSPLLTNIVYIDADSHDMTRGRTLYPHRVVEHLDDPPEGCEYLSITLTGDLDADE